MRLVWLVSISQGTYARTPNRRQKRADSTTPGFELLTLKWKEELSLAIQLVLVSNGSPWTLVP